MKPTNISLLVGIAIILSANATRATNHAEYYADPWYANWQGNNFDPPTLWFTVEFDRSLTDYRVHRTGDPTVAGYNFYWYRDIAGFIYSDLTWDATTGAPNPVEQADLEMGLPIDASNYDYNTEPDRVLSELLTWFAYPLGTPWRTAYRLDRSAYFRAVQASEAGNNSAAGPQGASGWVRAHYQTYPSGQSPDASNLQYDSSFTICYWDPGDTTAYFVNPGPVGVNSRLLNFSHQHRLIPP
jgi:hypothetical protein